MMTSDRARKAYKRAVAEHVVPFLRTAGFRGTVPRFFRRGTSVCQMVSFDYSKVRGEDEGVLAIRGCVGFVEIELLASEALGCAPSDGLPVPCTHQIEIGSPQPPYAYERIRVTGDTDAASLGARVLQDLREYALPGFGRYASLEQALATWESGPWRTLPEQDLCIGLAHWVLGRKAHALRMMLAKAATYSRHNQEHPRLSGTSDWERRASRLHKVCEYLGAKGSAVEADPPVGA
jgi:hypothetical protein